MMREMRQTLFFLKLANTALDFFRFSIVDGINHVSILIYDLRQYNDPERHHRFDLSRSIL